MPANYRASLKTTRMTDVRDDVDSGGSAGSLEIGDAGFASTLAVVPLDFPCGSVAGAVLTFAGFPKVTTAAGTGTAAEARIKESGGAVVADGFVVGTDLTVTPATITAGDTVTVTLATITHA
jgi:hypothetical protein